MGEIIQGLLIWFGVLWFVEHGLIAYGIWYATRSSKVDRELDEWLKRTRR